jgi:3-hydroxyisobutyrate dehydrogenase-like beta-hydroxyacid dehydrogenase
MTAIAFLGLGQMGAPMAARFAAAGRELRVWNRSPQAAAPLVAAGARLAAHPAAAVRGARAVFTMLATPEALEAVVFGEQGIAAGIESDTDFIEMSTVGVRAIRSLAARLPAGVALLDAPVLGSVPQATDGTLKIFVGGEPAVFERCRPDLEVLGVPRWFGKSGSGAAMKLVANSTLGALMTTLGEALALADGLQIDPTAALDVLAESPIGITVRSKRELIESDRYPPRFKLGLAAKDLRLVAEAAEDGGRTLRVGKAARDWIDAAAAAGLDGLDYSAVVAWIRGRPIPGS